MVHQKNLLRLISCDCLMVPLSVTFRNQGLENRIPLSIVRTRFQSRSYGERKMRPCQEQKQQHPLLGSGKPGTVRQILRKTNRVGETFHGCISVPHQLSSFLHEVHIPDLFIENRLPEPTNLNSILSLEHPRLKHLHHAGCFPHHILEVSRPCSRSEGTGIAIAQNQCSIQEPSHVVVRTRDDCL